MSSAGHPCYSGDDGSTVSCRRWVHPRSRGVRLCRWRCADEASDCRGFAGRRDRWPTSRQSRYARAARGAARGLPRPVERAARPDAHPDRSDRRCSGRRQRQRDRLPACRRPRRRQDRRSRSPCSSESSRLESSSASTRRLRRATSLCQLTSATRRATRSCVSPPTTANTQWTLRVVPTDATIADQNRDVFERHRLRPRNEAAAGRTLPTSPRPARKWRWPDNRAVSRRWTASTSSTRAGGYQPLVRVPAVRPRR